MWTLSSKRGTPAVFMPSQLVILYLCKTNVMTQSIMPQDLNCPAVTALPHKERKECARMWETVSIISVASPGVDEKEQGS